MAYAIAPPALAFCDSTCVPWLNSTYEKEYIAKRGQIKEKGGATVAQCDSPSDTLLGVAGWDCGGDNSGTIGINAPEKVQIDNNQLTLFCDQGSTGAKYSSGIVWIRCRRP
jgi:hypothetical protein